MFNYSKRCRSGGTGSDPRVEPINGIGFFYLDILSTRLEFRNLWWFTPCLDERLSRQFCAWSAFWTCRGVHLIKFESEGVGREYCRYKFKCKYLYLHLNLCTRYNISREKKISPVYRSGYIVWDYNIILLNQHVWLDKNFNTYRIRKRTYEKVEADLRCIVILRLDK